MDAASTYELGLTRLWYLIGNWEGSGKGPGLRIRARARCNWALGDHFLVLEMEILDAGSGQALSVEHSYIYYDHKPSQLVAHIFSFDGLVERAVGHADARGRMVLATDQVAYAPQGRQARRYLRTIWMMAASQWAFTIERDSGEGLQPYLEGQMRKV